MYTCKPIAIITGLILLGSCSISKPTVIDSSQGNEQQLNCMQLYQELERAKGYKKEAKSENRFMWKHVNPITGFISIYNMWKAEGRADDRITLLEGIINQKQCQYLQSGSPTTPYQNSPNTMTQPTYQTPYNQSPPNNNMNQNIKGYGTQAPYPSLSIPNPPVEYPPTPYEYGY